MKITPRLAAPFRAAPCAVWLAASCLPIALTAWPASAEQGSDWPCAQRKVQHLSWGQMWAGPPLPEREVWRGDAEIVALSARLSARRTPVEEAPALIDAAGLEGADRLAALFAGVFDQIDRERSRIVDGIGRFARKERARAERVDGLRAEIEARKAAAKADDFDELDAIEALEDELAWETRIYQDRRRSLAFVCESPVVLEKRAFALARMIQERLPEQP